MTGYVAMLLPVRSLPGDPSDLDDDVRLLRELDDLAQVAEDDRLALAGVDDVDRRRLLDRPRALLHPQGHPDAHLLRLARVLDGRLEGEIGGRDDRCCPSSVCSTCPLGSARVDTRLLPWRPVGVPPVDAPRMRVRTGAIARAVARSGVGQEDRRRHLDAGDVLLLQRGDRGRAEQVLPVDVARDEPPHLLGEHLAGPGWSLCSLLERVLEAAQPGDAELERGHRLPVLVA